MVQAVICALVCTETALVKVNLLNLLMASYSGPVSMLALLDLPAAFSIPLILTSVT